MNLENILGEIEKVDPEIYDRLDTRRKVMQRFKSVSGRLALAALPIAFGSMLKKAYGQPATATVAAILNYALTLEYLEAEYYQTAVSRFTSIGVPVGAAQGAIRKIADDEAKHVAFLRAGLQGAGATPVTKPTFDFSGNQNGTTPQPIGAGPFAAALSTTFNAANYGLFLAVAQTFEDTGVRAYKGRAKELTRGGDYLTYALNIHSVEARHASHIRQMRFALNTTSPTTSLVPTGVTVKPWITLNQSGIGSTAVQATYNGDEVVTQAGVTITGIGGSGVSANAASESFDEALDATAVLAIVRPFIVP
jgi:hypothetical protein